MQYLLLEVANGILISVSEEIEDVVFDVVLLEVVHQMSAIALTLKRQRGEMKYTEKQVLNWNWLVITVSKTCMMFI